MGILLARIMSVYNRKKRVYLPMGIVSQDNVTVYNRKTRVYLPMGILLARIMPQHTIERQRYMYLWIFCWLAQCYSIQQKDKGLSTYGYSVGQNNVFYLLMPLSRLVAMEKCAMPNTVRGRLLKHR